MASRILVVDDDLQVLKLFATILEKGGYSVVVAASGKKVMELLRQDAFDLLVLDLSMPQPDGFELLRALRSSMPGLRILVISGFMGGVLLRPARFLGATATLPKSEAPAQLLKTVKNLLRKQPPLNDKSV